MSIVAAAEGQLLAGELGLNQFPGPLRISFCGNWYRIEDGSFLDWFPPNFQMKFLQQIREER